MFLTISLVLVMIDVFDHQSCVLVMIDVFDHQSCVLVIICVLTFSFKSQVISFYFQNFRVDHVGFWGEPRDDAIGTRDGPDAPHHDARSGWGWWWT